MKRILIVIIVVFISVSPGFAVDYLLGVKAGYFVWEPFFQELEGGGLSDVKTGSGVLYGPVISVIISPSVTFSISGFFGEQGTKWFSGNHIQTWPGLTQQVEMSGTYFAEMQRIDVDSALSYKVAEKFKVFVGYKYQRIMTEIKYTERRREVPVPGEHAVLEGTIEAVLPSHGPALGLGFSQPIGNSFFAAANISVIYMWSKMDLIKNEYRTYPVSDLIYTNSTLTREPTPSYDMHQVGVNIEPTLGALVNDTGVVFTVGARLQYMRLEFIDGFEGAPERWTTDILYGFFASVLYNF